MNQQEKQIRIAKACGKGHRKVTGMEALSLGAKLGSYVQSSDTPDYFGDLNACHEMEEVIHHNDENGEQAQKRVLYEMLIYDVSETPIRATAAQRAEAFGLTLGLWKEGE